MLGNQDINYSLISAVREGRLERTRELINSFGLCYSQQWSEGYVLLCDALKNKHAEIAKLLLTSGSKVNSKSVRPTNTPLHFAVINGDIEIVEMILEKGANIDAKNQDGRTPLHNAIENKKIAVTELLLKHRADVNDTYKDGRSLLHVAVKIGCLQNVEHLLNYGAYVNCVYSSRWENGCTPLHVAVEEGNEKVTTLLLSRGANVDNVKGKDGITPLHIAANKGYTRIAEDLLNHGASTHSSTLKEGYTPLHFASEKGNKEAVKLFLNKGADINARTKGNVTPLHIATKTGHKTVVKLLLQHGAKVDNQDNDGKTILHLAVIKGDLTIVQDVLKYCPDINNQSNRSSLKIAVLGYGETNKNIVSALIEYGFNVDPEDANSPDLLYAAVEKGYLKIIEDLIKYGSHVNMSKIEDDFTPLHSAAKNKQEEVAKLLISYEADINAQDKTGKTPINYAIESADFKITKLLLTNGAYIKDSPELLSIAVEKECMEIVEALLQHDADINASDKYGRTALHFTALRESECFFGTVMNEVVDENIKGEIARLLLSKGANVNAKQKDGKTTLHLATQNGYKEVVKVLLECGAKVNSKIKNDITALHLGAEKGYEEIIEIILKFGADINSRDEYGRTALHIASEKGHIGVVETLLKYGSDINITSRDNHTPLKYALNGIIIRSSYTQFDDYNYDGVWDYDNDRDGCSCEEVVEILGCHILKMKTANLYVSKKNLLPLSRGYCIEMGYFVDKCKKEIASIKSEKIINSKISFYDILTKDTSSLAIYMSNENIVQVLKSGDYKTKFPIYATIIESHFRKVMKKKELLEQCNTIFHFIFNNFPELPYDCTEKIFCYLNDEDLKNFVGCAELSELQPTMRKSLHCQQISTIQDKPDHEHDSLDFLISSLICSYSFDSM